MGMSGNLIRFGATLDNKVSSQLRKMRGDFDDVAKTRGFQSVTQGIGMGVGIQAWGVLDGAVSMAVNSVMGGITAASDFAETVSKSQAVFGDSAKELTAWGDNAAAAMGMSKRTAIEAAGTFGNLFTSMGLAKGASLDMSTSLIQLAADLASFNNQNPEEVLMSLRSGLVGEVEPLRRFGIAMSGVSVEAKVMEMGLASTRKEITEQMKVQARYAIILEQTRTAQGDYARTADGLANTQRTLKAELENITIELGEKFLPIALELAKFVKNTLMPAFGSFIENLDKLLPLLVAVAAVIATRLLGNLFALGKAFAGTAMAVQTLTVDLAKVPAQATAATTSLNALKASLAGMAAVAAVSILVTVWMQKRSEIEQQGRELVEQTKAWAVKATTEQLKAAEQAYIDGMRSSVLKDPGNFLGGREAIEAGWKVVNDELVDRATITGGEVRHALNVAANFADDMEIKPKIEPEFTPSAISNKAREAARAYIEALKTGLREKWSAVEGSMGELLERLVATIENPKLKEKYQAGATALLDELKKPMTGAQRVALLREYTDLGTDAGAFLAQALELGDPLLEEAYKDWLETTRTELSSLLVYLSKTGEDGTLTYADGMATTAAKRRTLTRLGEITGIVKTVLSKPADLADDWGANIGEAWVHGMKVKLGSRWAYTEITNAAAAALRGIKGGSPPEVGPLHYVDDWGANIGEAWSEGLIGGAQRALRGGIRGVGAELMGAGPTGIAPAGRAGGSMTVELHYSPAYSTASPEEARRFARALIPELERERRRLSLA